MRDKTHTMRQRIAMTKALALAAFGFLMLAAGPVARAEVGEPPTGAVVVTHELTINAPPAAVWQSLTGDISGWWDHSVSKDPARLVIEPVPGGGFREYFADDPEQGGLLHARVTMVRPEKQLILTGPLGFFGSAVMIVSTIELAGEEDETAVKLKAEMAGHLEDGWGDALDRAWRHFLVERLKPYVEAGCHTNPDCGVFASDSEAADSGSE